ncbi:MAG: UvrD-helicase domain-containing protein [Victivallales bacterium]|nr:UvrD-helicase domain-containing protein [Victivallales bacterium]
MAKMNDRQQEAVDCLDGALLLLAGAGTGKTTVIVHRIANLVMHQVAPSSILAVTFTNKAAREMRERVGAMLGPGIAKQMTISTFHSFCSMVLRRHIAKLGYSRNFSIAGEGYQQGLINEIMKELGQVGQGYDTMLWRTRISLAKAEDWWPDDLRENSPYPRAAEVADVYERYQTRMRLMDLLDFDDLLCLTVKLWKDFPEVLASYRQKYQYIMIDEYQDTNGVQLKLMTMLAGEHGNIAVVGDDDQSIYGWRGANIENILHFDSLFPKARVIRLEQNYRSTNVILKAANELIAHNRERHVKTLWSSQEQGELIRAVRCEDETAEAEFIARSTSENLKKHALHWRNFAVLFRSARQSRALEDAFRKQHIPYVLVGGTSFYERKENLDAIAFLEAVQNPHNDLAFLRVVNVPPRGIGDTTIERLRSLRDETRQSLQALAVDPSMLARLPADGGAALREFALVLKDFRENHFAEPGMLHDKTEALFQRLNYLEGLARMYKPRENALVRRENVLELLNSIAEFDQQNHAGTLEALLERYNLMDANDRADEKGVPQDAVTLMTVHAAKGLEFDTVYVAGMERDLFPHERALEEGNEAEERRLCYVAITRAKRELYLTYAEKRRDGKVLRPHSPSKFLNELPDECVQFCKPDDLYVKLSGADAVAFLLGNA